MSEQSRIEELMQENRILGGWVDSRDEELSLSRERATTIRRAYRARFNRIRRCLDEIAPLLTIDPDNISGTEIADMRALVEDITQCFHEFNAYSNAYRILTRSMSGPSSEAEQQPSKLKTGVRSPRPAPAPRKKEEG